VLLLDFGVIRHLVWLDFMAVIQYHSIVYLLLFACYFMPFLYFSCVCVDFMLYFFIVKSLLFYILVIRAGR